MNVNPAVVEGEAPESDDDVDLSGQEATEDLYDDSYEDDNEQIDCDACEEVREDTNINRNSDQTSPKSTDRQSQSSLFPASISASSLRSIISSKSTVLTASPKKSPTKYPGILHKQLREKNISLMKKLTDIQTVPYRESTARCMQLLEASERTLIMSRETLHDVKKTRFNLITACSKLEDALTFASSSQANWCID